MRGLCFVLGHATSRPQRGELGQARGGTERAHGRRRGGRELGRQVEAWQARGEACGGGRWAVGVPVRRRGRLAVARGGDGEGEGEGDGSRARAPA